MRRTAHVALCLLVSQSICAIGALADEPPAVQIPGTEAVELTDGLHGRPYALHIKLPRSYHQPVGRDRVYPVVYATDSHVSFSIIEAATLYGMSTGLLDEAIIVGISREVGASASDSRIRDFTPTRDETWRVQTGGADDHIRFIREDVIPYIESEYRVSPEDRTFVGNSLGGLFGAYILLTDPGLFGNYVLGSPSLWYDAKYILRIQASGDFEKPTAATNIFVAVGAHETPEHVDIRNDLVADAMAFVSRIEAWQLDHIRVKSLIIPEAIHEMAFPTSATHGLFWVLRNDASE